MHKGYYFPDRFERIRRILSIHPSTCAFPLRRVPDPPFFPSAPHSFTYLSTASRFKLLFPLCFRPSFIRLVIRSRDISFLSLSLSLSLLILLFVEFTVWNYLAFGIFNQNSFDWTIINLTFHKIARPIKLVYKRKKKYRQRSTRDIYFSNARSTRNHTLPLFSTTPSDIHQHPLHNTLIIRSTPTRPDSIEEIDR